MKKSNLSIIGSLSFIKKQNQKQKFIENLNRIIKIISNNEELRSKNIYLIFSNADYISRLNKLYLKKNYATDILVFLYDDDDLKQECDMLICIQTVKKNAELYDCSFMQELFRVFIHGLLHICGYKDNTKSGFKMMKNKEEYYLNILYKETGNVF